jgi:hypothetical protein
MSAQSYPYTTAPATLRKILSSAPNIGRPPKVDRAWLDAAGYRSTNDRTVVSVLKFAGILGDDSTPTVVWDALRSPTKANKAKVADAVRKAYAGLFAMYPDAHRKDAEALRNFFRAHTTAGEQAQKRMLQTFQVLVEFGDFDAEAPAGARGEQPKVEAPEKQKEQTQKEQSQKVAGEPPPMTLTVNIQLQLPATAEAEVYEKLFAAMRKHLIDLTQST